MLKRHATGTTLFGSTLIVLSSVFYGSYGIWTRLMGNHFGPFMQSWIRAAFVIAIMLPVALYTKRWRPIHWRVDRGKLGIFVLVNSLIGASQYYAIVHIGIGLGLLTLYASYLVSMFVLGRLFSGERYGTDKLFATILALAGLVLTLSPSFGHATLLPFLAAAVAGVCIGVEMIIAQKLAYGSLQTTILAWATGMAGSIPLAFLLREHVPGPHNYSQWGYLLLFVTCCIGASWLSVHGVKLVEAGVAGILGLLEVVWGIAFGVVFFHERPGLLAYIGAVCIIAAATVPYMKELRKPKQEILEEIPA